jgi:hypothetical protein
MTIKNVFAPLNGFTANGFALDTALLVAKNFRAHAEISYVKEDAQIATRAVAAQDFAVSLAREQIKREKLARQKFDDLITKHRIDYREASLPAELPSAYWRLVEGTTVDVIEQRGAAYDLIVVPRYDNTVASRTLVEAALFGTGCPVLVSPPRPPKVIGEHIMIGWNQGIPAARAIRFAMPFLEMAARVEIFSVATGAKKGVSPQDIRRYLAWHNIKTELNSRLPDQRSVGEVLLSEASASGADLVVMGAFSHSRLRQLVLGGVTNYVLEHADMPVLMAH